MTNGDLVEAFGHDRHCSLIAQQPRVIGVLMGWDNSDDGWILLIDGQLRVFPKIWWTCKTACTP